MAKSKAPAAPAAKAGTAAKNGAGKNSAQKAQAGSEDASLRHLYLVDGSGYLFRAYHALPPMTRPDGTPVNAVFGFSNMLAKLLRERVAAAVAGDDRLGGMDDLGRRPIGGGAVHLASRRPLWWGGCV